MCIVCFIIFACQDLSPGPSGSASTSVLFSILIDLAARGRPKQLYQVLLALKHVYYCCRINLLCQQLVQMELKINPSISWHVSIITSLMFDKFLGPWLEPIARYFTRILIARVTYVKSKGWFSVSTWRNWLIRVSPFMNDQKQGTRYWWSAS